ncbi:hypothetical protein Ddc_22561 [Ditylenchus destructor]|nr:hypothetical protein Ddc_22561 [Ditylenchus destructor]
MPIRLLSRLCDFLLLFAAAALFGACLTAKLQTGSYGLAMPDAPYLYERSDFFLDASFAGLVAWLALAVAERFTPLGRSAIGRAVAGMGAALLAIYLGPPAPIVFGNTWARWEPTFELFLAQWDIALPLAVAVVAARQGIRKLASHARAVQQLRRFDPFFGAVAAAVQAGDEDHADGAGGRHVDRVVARAAGQAHAGVAQLVGGGLHRVHHQRCAVGGLGAAQLGEAGGQAQRLQVVGHRGHQRFGKCVQHRIAVAAHFQRQFDAAGHGVGGVGRHGQLAYRGHYAGRAHQGIAADVHGGGAGVVGLAFDHDLHAADTDDVGDHADGQLAAFQHGALFDVQFDECGGAVGAAQGGVERGRVAADAGDALGQRFAVGVAGGQHVGAELAAERAAADARNSVVAGLFGQEVDDLEVVLQFDALFLQGVGDFDAGQHADDAVEAAAAGHGVAMRAGGDGLAGGVAAGAGPRPRIRRAATGALPGTAARTRGESRAGRAG